MKHTFMVCPVSGTNTGTMVFDCLEGLDVYDKIVTSDIYAFSYAAHISEHFHVLPMASTEAFLPRLLEVVEAEGVQVLIPGSDWELKKIAAHRDAFTARGVGLLINSDAVLRIGFDKKATADFLRDHGFLFPRTAAVSPDDLASLAGLRRAVLDSLDYPFLLKPNLVTGGSANILAVQDDADLRAFQERYAASGMHFVAQQYVGSPDEEYTLGVMSDTRGKVISSFALRRDLSTPRTRKLSVPRKDGKGRDIVVSGNLTQGYVDDFPQLRRVAEDMAVALDSRGPLNIQCRLTDAGVSVFEINPRFSGTTSIRAAMGHNDVELVYNAVVNGINMGQQPYRRGTAIRGQKVVVRTGP